RRPARRARFGQALDDRRVIAAQVGEDERDARFVQRLYQCRARGVHLILFVLFPPRSGVLNLAVRLWSLRIAMDRLNSQRPSTHGADVKTPTPSPQRRLNPPATFGAQTGFSRR